MNFKSIKWQLQLWYGLILVLVLVGFGVTAYQLERNRVFRRVDDELRHRTSILMQELRHPRHGHPGGFGPEADGPPFDFPADTRLTPGPPPKFNLSPQAAALFDSADPGGFYFIIEGPRGEIARSTNAPDQSTMGIDWPSIVRQNQPPDRLSPGRRYDGPEERGAAGIMSGPDQPAPHRRGAFRESLVPTPADEWILVGRSIKPELTELRVTAFKLAGIGGVILLLGLAGGGWFVGRSLRPISAISAAAAQIATGDLSRRINSAEAESELGQLAAVLNSTFARLETAFVQQKQFASDAAHELRTPVSVILTQTQMTLSRERDAAGYKQTVEACGRAAQRMRRLIESLLELARFDAGQEVLKRLPFDLAKTVTECVELVQPLAAEGRLRISCDLQPAAIIGDPERMAQVAANLLTNALQYNRPDGSITVKSFARDGLAILEISDTGQGIAPGDLPHIFERFYRADKARTGQGNSHAGLGLSICKAIVEAHGGSIEAASQVSVGTCFTVRLPAGTAPQTSAPRQVAGK